MRKFVIVIIIFLIVGAFIGWQYYQKGVPTLESVEADFALTADELFDAYDTDEAEASKLYDQKVVEVTGTIVAITEQEKGSNITLEASNALMGGVSCGFATLPETAQMGTIFTCRCRCQGFLMDVILNNCYAID